MIDFEPLKNRLNNSIESRHSTDYLADCKQCGMKPKRLWSHSGTALVCKCNVLTDAGGGAWGTLEYTWQNLQDASKELDELKKNLADALHDHNMYRAEMQRRLEHLTNLYASNTQKTLIWQIEKMLKITRKQDHESVS